MPQDPTVWIVLIVAAALVLGLALWLGRGLRIRKDKRGFSFEAEKGQPEPASDNDVVVGRGLRIDKAKVGDITGIKSDGFDAMPSAKQKSIDVLSEGSISDTSTGDISGIKQQRK